MQSSKISARNQRLSMASFQVLLYPKSAKPSARHIQFQDRRPVLAARYEPSSRILALLLPVKDTGGSKEHIHAIAFLAFTPDFKQLQVTHELPVVVQGDCTVGPSGVDIYTGELPIVLLPAVADSDGAGMSNKVCCSDFLMAAVSLRLHLKSSYANAALLPTPTGPLQS